MNEKSAPIASVCTPALPIDWRVRSVSQAASPTC
jgi:hypothetical protein